MHPPQGQRDPGLEHKLGRAAWSAAWVCKMRRFAGNCALSSSNPVQGAGGRSSPAGSGVPGGLHPSTSLLSMGAGFPLCPGCGPGFRARGAGAEKAGNSWGPGWSPASAAGLSGAWGGPAQGFPLTLSLLHGGFYGHRHGCCSGWAVSPHTELWHYLFSALTSLLQTVREMQPEWQISLIMLLHSSSLCYI